MRQRIRLRDVAGSGGRVWGVGELIYVGNSDGPQIRLSDPSVKPYHALIRWTGGRWVVRDMNSAHGTFVNGDRLGSAERVLGASDRIRFGNSVVDVESVGVGSMLFDDNWDSCDDPTDMIDCWAGRATTRRKWRLLALACLRRLWRHLDGRQRSLVEEAGRAADEGLDILPSGEAPVGGVEGASHPTHGTVGKGRFMRWALSEVFGNDPAGVARMIREGVMTTRNESVDDSTEWYEGIVQPRRSDSLLEAFLANKDDDSTEGYDDYSEETMSESLVEDFLANTNQGGTREEGYSREGWLYAHEPSLANSLRCIFPNPFRPLPAIDPFWLAWNDHSVPRLAQAMHDEGAFDQLTILADALMDAGCSDGDILAHLRKPGIHAKGCWVIDSLLGKM